MQATAAGFFSAVETAEDDIIWQEQGWRRWEGKSVGRGGSKQQHSLVSSPANSP